MAPAGVLFKCQKSGGGEKLPEVMHKSLQFDVASIDEEQGIFDGYASVWDVIDHDGDVVEHGAFAYTIREGVAKDGVPILALHNDHWLPVGRTLELREDDVGLYIRGYISPTSMGKDVRILIRDKVLKELSIGYCVVRHVMQDGIRHLIRRLLHPAVEPQTEPPHYPAEMVLPPVHRTHIVRISREVQPHHRKQHVRCPTVMRHHTSDACPEIGFK